MAFQTTWYFSELSEKVVEFIERDLSEDSNISDTHWVGGFVWHYIDRANRENFLYDLSHLDGDSVKLKIYNEGDKESWNVDAKPSTDENIRKISFIIQLSDHNDYEGGNIQILDETSNMYNVPRKRGTVSLFDSTAQYRMSKITKGTRKSLIGWAVGKRWT